MPPDTERERAATFLQRAGAYLIDSGILLGAWFVAFMAAGAALTGLEDDSSESNLIGLFIIVFGPSTWFMYQWVCNALGASLGKKVMHLAIEPIPGPARLPQRAGLGAGNGFVRTIGQVISAVPLGLGFWWALWDPEHRAWHDRMAGTRVVGGPALISEGSALALSEKPRSDHPWWKKLLSARRKEDEQRALEEALAADMPLGAADRPFSVRLGRWWIVVLQAFHVVLAVVFLVIGRVFQWDWGLMALIGGLVLLTLAGSWPELYGLTQKLTISGGGVKLEGLPGPRSVSWYAVSRVLVRPDLADMRVAGISTRLTWSASALPIDKRKEILLAIRARLPESVRVEEWKGQQLATFVPGAVVGAVGVALLFTSSLLGIPSGKALGIRCSVTSEYLRTRFDQPDQRGCIVLRVSGPAERAGIRQGDLMIEMNGVPIVSGSQFSILFDSSRSDTFGFTMLRSGEARPLEFRFQMGPTKGPKEDKSDPVFYYLRARFHSERKHIDRDIADYSRAIELAPEFDIAYMYRGELFQEVGDLAAARADYERAIELSPDLGAAHQWLATVDQDEGEIEQALHGFERAIAVDECEGGFTRYNIECAEDYLLLAGLYQGTDIEKVREAAQRSIEFYPRFAAPYYQLAVDHYFRDEDAEAQRYAQEYLAFPRRDVDPDRVAALRALLSETPFNCDGRLENAPRFHCPLSYETSTP